MNSIAAQLQETREALLPVAGANAALEARLLAAHAWGMSGETLVKHALEPRDYAALKPLLERRLRHEPIAQILGYKEFWRDRFLVGPEVLTPRADSETMIEALVALKAERTVPMRVLDLGTGSGCLLLSALREYTQATGIGVDQSTAALALATKNAAVLGLAERASFVQGDWCSKVDGKFDVILANPPYIPSADIATLAPDVQAYEPHAALDGGADGLNCYRSILAQLKNHLQPEALVLFEVGIHQAAEVAQLGKLYGFTLLKIFPDLAGIDRVVVLQSPFSHA